MSVGLKDLLYQKEQNIVNENALNYRRALSIILNGVWEDSVNYYYQPVISKEEETLNLNVSKDHIGEEDNRLSIQHFSECCAEEELIFD